MLFLLRAKYLASANWKSSASYGKRHEHIFASEIDYSHFFFDVFYFPFVFDVQSLARKI